MRVEPDHTSIPAFFIGGVSIDDYCAADGTTVQAIDAQTHELLAETTVRTVQGFTGRYRIQVPVGKNVVFLVDGYRDDESEVEKTSNIMLGRKWLAVSKNDKKIIPQVVHQPAPVERDVSKDVTNY